MKKCIRCGKNLPSEVKICDNCSFDFQEYEAYQKAFAPYVEKEDPVVPESQRSSLIDNPIITFILGIVSLLFMFLFLFTPKIVVLYLIGVILFVILTYIMATFPSKVKLVHFQNIGRWMANIAISVTIFKIVYVVLGMFFF
jgi:membrane-bound ClpP family serine protease